MFEVGQKVVCVDDRPGFVDGRNTLMKGKIYTILDAFVGWTCACSSR